jgi:hypothetical protein
MARRDGRRPTPVDGPANGSFAARSPKASSASSPLVLWRHGHTTSRWEMLRPLRRCRRTPGAHDFAVAKREYVDEVRFVDTSRQRQHLHWQGTASARGPLVHREDRRWNEHGAPQVFDQPTVDTSRLIRCDVPSSPQPGPMSPRPAMATERFASMRGLSDRSPPTLGLAGGHADTVSALDPHTDGQPEGGQIEKPIDHICRTYRAGNADSLRATRNRVNQQRRKGLREGRAGLHGTSLCRCRPRSSDAACFAATPCRPRTRAVHY